MVEPFSFPIDPYVRRAKLHRIIDGDTVVLTIDLGWYIYVEHGVRLLGLNAPEKSGATRDAGIAATLYVAGWFQRYRTPVEWPFVLRSEKTEKYGRFLGTIWSADGVRCLNTMILDAGHAVVYP